MKHICFLLLIFLFTKNTTAQAYQPFVVEGAHLEMTVGRCYQCNPGGDPQCPSFYSGVDYFKMEGDSIVNDTLYKKLFISDSGSLFQYDNYYDTLTSTSVNCEPWELTALLREDTMLKKVYMLGQIGNLINQTDSILYDFSLLPGDTLLVRFYSDGMISNAVDTETYVVDSIGNTQIADSTRRTLFFTEASGPMTGFFYSWQLIEGYGPNFGLFGNPGGFEVCYSTDGLSYCVGSDSMCPHTCILTGITPVTENNSINIYPNPAHNSLTIEFDQPLQGAASLNIYDITGAEVLRRNIALQNTEINIATLAPGIYVIRMVDKTSNLNTIRRFVKQD